MKRIILIFIIAILLVYLIIMTTNHTKIDMNSDSEKFDGTLGQSQLLSGMVDMFSNPVTQNNSLIKTDQGIKSGDRLVMDTGTGHIPVDTSTPASTPEIQNDLSSDILIQKPQTDKHDGEVCEPNELKCNTDKCGLDNLHPILDPRFNMRETAKQCLLLEDHLNNTKKRCFDCIRKHFLTVDGFLEEAVSLEKDNKERDYYRHLYLEWVKLEKQYAKDPKNSDNLDDISKKIRMFRKPLVERYFDTVSEYDD